MKEKIKDVLIRAGKTFWQAMLATALVSLQEIIELIPVGWEALKPVLISAIVGAIAAGLSAVYNGVLAPFIVKLKNKQVESEVGTDGGESAVDKGE